MSPKTAIYFLNHERIRCVENGERHFFPFWNLTTEKKLSDASFYSFGGHDAASLNNFENLWILQFFDKFQIWKKFSQNSAFSYD